MVDVRVDAAVRDEPEQMDVLTALEGGPQDGVSKNEPSSIDLFTRIRSWKRMRPGADRQMADLGVAHLARREADRLARGLERRVRVLGPEAVEDRRVRVLDRVPGPGGARPQPSRMTSATSG